MENVFNNNDTAIISGGLGDIGSAAALELAKHGANVALCDLHPVAEARELLEKMNQYGVGCKYNQVNVADVDSVRNWVDEVEIKINTPNIIIANAATVTPAGINEITPEQWSRELRVNLDGAFYLAKSTTDRLLHHDLPGRVIFIGSWAGEKVHSHIPAYSVSKAGIRMLCKCMALELAPYNILVNELALGFVEAGLSAQIWKENPDMKNEAQEKVPLKNLISVEEVAQQVVQLSIPQNNHMTGSTLLMDGGLSLLA